MVKNQNTDNTKCWQGYEATLLKEMQNGIGATAESNSTVPQKVQHRINMWSRNPLPICVSIPEDG